MQQYNRATDYKVNTRRRVAGAGLAGLAAARDLAPAGADGVVLEARERPGGRVEQELLADGRPIQFGAELTAEWQAAYVELVAELGLTLEPSYTALASLRLGRPRGHRGRRVRPWMDTADVEDLSRLDGELAALARGVDPDDPWRHPEAGRLDALSLDACARAPARGVPGHARGADGDEALHPLLHAERGVGRFMGSYEPV